MTSQLGSRHPIHPPTPSSQWPQDSLGWGGLGWALTGEGEQSRKVTQRQYHSPALEADMLG